MILELDNSLIFYISHESISFRYQIGERCVLSDPKLKWRLLLIKCTNTRWNIYSFSDCGVLYIKYEMRDTLFIQVLDHFGSYKSYHVTKELFRYTYPNTPYFFNEKMVFMDMHIRKVPCCVFYLVWVVSGYAYL